MLFDPVYWIVILICMGLAGWTKMKVDGAFKKYSRVAPRSNLSGAEAAYQMLQQAGLEGRVGIEAVRGHLSDHYDPSKKVLRLSPEVYNGRSLAAVGIACHEVGHAIQDAKRYAPLVIRNAIVPTASIGSNLGLILVIAGLFMSALFGQFGYIIAIVGLLLFASVVLFQVVNLPVEFDASRRAKAQLVQLGIVRGDDEARGVASVLDAAAMTYVAAALAAALQLAYWAMIVLGGRRD